MQKHKKVKIVLWLNTQSNSFYIGNGTKQGCILSPYLFTRYIRQLLLMISTSKIGCHVGGIALIYLLMQMTLFC